MVNCSWTVSEPAELVASIVTLNQFIASTGVPDITPVVEFKMRPGGMAPLIETQEVAAPPPSKGLIG